MSAKATNIVTEEVQNATEWENLDSRRGPMWGFLGLLPESLHQGI